MYHVFYHVACSVHAHIHNYVTKFRSFSAHLVSAVVLSTQSHIIYHQVIITTVRSQHTTKLDCTGKNKRVNSRVAIAVCIRTYTFVVTIVDDYYLV